MGRESCQCLETIGQAAERRRRAEEERRQAVDELHAAIVQARDAPACNHSLRELGQASGLSQGGLHNVMVGAGARERAS